MDSESQHSPPQSAQCSGESWRSLPILLAFALAYVGAIFMLKFVPMPRAAEISVALTPVLLFAWYIWHWMRGVRRLDELQRLITLEALAFAYPVSLLLILTLGLLELAGLGRPNFIDYLQLWPLVFWFYFIGLIIARRRYA